MGKNKPIIGFILGIIVAVVIFFANIPGLYGLFSDDSDFLGFWYCSARLCLRSVSFAFSSF